MRNFDHAEFNRGVTLRVEIENITGIGDKELHQTTSTAHLIAINEPSKTYNDGLEWILNQLKSGKSIDYLAQQITEVYSKVR